MKRAPTPRPVERKIEFFVGAKRVKTVKTKITRQQATREIGEERLFTRGDTTRMQRRIGRFAQIVVTWSVTHSTITNITHTWKADTQTAAEIARRGMIG